MLSRPDPAALYHRHAHDWDEDRGASRPPGEAAWIDRFLGLTPERSEILDLGCGSGAPIAAQIARTGRAVTGVDAAPALIELCRKRLPGHRFETGDMRTLDLEQTFDGVVCWHALFHLSPADQPGVLSVFARHLKPGAPLLFTSGTEHGETIGTWRGEPLYHASLATAEYRQLLELHGFEVIDHVIEDPRTGSATVWLARRGEAPSAEIEV